ncbi:MAG: sulfatase-like hydrolase/transferase, partial [Ferruginibacter sp.]|nr:sulfatase-like hydrolase/transferase [Ferruginibacter sp.]
MKPRLSFLAAYFFFWVFLFILGRVFFLWITYRVGEVAGFNECWGVFRHGLLMDISTATYFTVPVLILMLAGTWIPILNRRLPFVVYSILLLIPVLLLYVSDGYSYNAWGHHLEAGVLRYLQNPKEAWASVSNLPVGWIFLGVIITILLIIILTVRGIRRFIPFPPANRWWVSLMIVLLAGLAIIPMRGGVQLAPINQSSVYFSENNYANQSAINPVWNFIHSVKLERKSEVNPFVFMDMAKAKELISPLLLKQDQLLTDSVKRKNVILVVWESFTEKVLDKDYHGVEITPRFNQLKKEGLYFSNIYATGDRTDKGIVGVLSGYPSQPINSIVKFPNKTRSLPMLTAQLSKHGYFTGFYYGGEPEFANIKSYLLHSRLDKIIDVHHFAEADRNSKWGAHDGVVMNYLLKEIPLLPQPFFATWLTLSSHEPYETPVPTAIQGKDDVSLFLNSLHYTDEVLYQFIEACRKMPFWENTLLVVV